VADGPTPADGRAHAGSGTIEPYAAGRGRAGEPLEARVAQEGYDRLMALTDSRYRLSMIVARRAAQLKGGIPTTLDVDEMPAARHNTVTLAMREFELGRDVRWGDELPSFDELKRTVVEEKRREEPSFTVSRAAVEDDDED
jgi:DNA-directed RNA polymerase subunit omega